MRERLITKMFLSYFLFKHLLLCFFLKYKDSLPKLPLKDAALSVIFQLLGLSLLYRILPAGVSRNLHHQVTSSLIKIAHVAICNFLIETPGLAGAQGFLHDTEWEGGCQDVALSPWISEHLTNTGASHAFFFPPAPNLKTTFMPSVKL